MKKFRIELGNEVKDKVTGFRGIIMGRADYSTGCDQYLVQPQGKKKDDDKYPESRWFDDARLKVIGEGITIDEIQGDEPGCDYTAPVK